MSDFSDLVGVNELKLVSKILIGVGAAVIIVPVALFTYVYAAAQWENYRFARASPIAVGLPRNIHEASDEFQRRIRDKFPIGTPQSELIDTLTTQGFRLEQGNGWDKKPYRWMHLTKLGDVVTDICARDWYVSWEADPNDKLSSVDASYYVTCS